MSVRMALAKLCACVCGGAIVGGGTVHIVERAPSRGSVVHRKIRPVAHLRTTAAGPGRQRVGGRVRPLVATDCAITPTPLALMSAQGSPVAVSPQYVASSFTGGGTPLLGDAGNGLFAQGFLGGSGSGGGRGFGSAPGGSGTRPGANGTGSSPTSREPATGTATGGSGGPSSPGDPGSAATVGTTPSSGRSSGGSPSLPVRSVSDDVALSTSGASDGNGSNGGPPAPVPAPPMVLLFGAAAAVLVVRRRFLRRSSASA